MAGPILYSTNPWIAHTLSMRYLSGKHVIWCSEYFDSAQAPPGSAAAAIAASSSPRTIFDILLGACQTEDRGNHLIKGYRKTFRRLAAQWLDADTITSEQHAEIIAQVKAPTFRIWTPIIYVIPRAHIEAAGRLLTVPYKRRSGYGPELQIVDLQPDEFDIIHGRLG